MKRITVEDVLSAYRATGLKPSTGVGIRGVQCCGFEACEFAAGGQGVLEKTLGRDYRLGFWDGFDGHAGEIISWDVTDKERFAHGREDGQAAAAAVFAESPAGEPR